LYSGNTHKYKPALRIEMQNITFKYINPYPANVENRVNS
jgi:hypothetical protein